MHKRKHGSVQSFFRTNREKTWKYQKFKYRVKFINILRFKASSLSSSAHNLAKGFYGIKMQRLYINLVLNISKLLIND